MGMVKGEKIEKWIDLSVLPKNKKGQVAWCDSTGIKIPFKYGETSGTVELLEYVGDHKYNIMFNINDEIIPYCINSSLIGTCSFGYALKQPIGVSHPELIKYFVNKEDAFKHPAYYTKPTNMMCPICGYQKQQTYELLTLGGFSCPRCSDGKSYAEKFMANILCQLNVEFINEVTKKYDGFEWMGDYRYDFYININNQKILIEMDGHFHDGSKFYSYEESHKIDVAKNNLANENGFIIIRVDCCYPDICNRYEYIRTSILNSDVSKILNLNIVNWDVANEQATNSYIKRAADLFNCGIKSVVNIGKTLGVCRGTVRKYLKVATDIGWCNYTIIDGKSLDQMKPIALYKGDTVVGVFRGASDLSKKSQQLYGVYMDVRSISAVCNQSSRLKRVKGYVPKHIAYDEYEQLLSQFQTIQNECNNLQEVI